MLRNWCGFRKSPPDCVIGLDEIAALTAFEGIDCLSLQMITLLLCDWTDTPCAKKPPSCRVRVDFVSIRARTVTQTS